jgi:hypothetical protein
MSLRLRFQALLIAIALPLTVQASESRTIGVVSLVADHLTVTGFEATTGTRINSNPTERIELKTDDLERTMLRAAIAAISETKAGKAVPLLIDDAAIYSGQSNIVSGDTATIPKRLRDALESQKVTHLLLITKLKAEARMNTGITQLGTGQVEGLGFFVDRVTPLVIVDTNERSLGYIAPHVYVRASLIDLKDNRVLRSKAIQSSTVVSARVKDRGADPWDFLDSAGKMKAIADLIARDSSPGLRSILE